MDVVSPALRGLMRVSASKPLTSLAVLALALGCGDPSRNQASGSTGGGEEGEGEMTGASEGEGEGEAAEPFPGFESVFDILTGSCVGYCHDANAGQMQFMDEQTTYDSVMAGAATEAVCGLTDRVVPGDPENSILWVRIRAPVAGDDCAVKMPKDSPELSAEALQTIYDWIAGGALR